MPRVLFTIGSFLGLCSVLSGAFATHVLEKRLDSRALKIFELASHYQMFHALALLGAAWLVERSKSTLAYIAGCAFVVGTILFCGSLYGISIIGLSKLGMIAPIGGITLMVGWLCLGIAAWQAKTN